MLPPELDITIRHDDNEVVVALAGEIDISTVSRLTAAVEEALSKAAVADPPTGRLVLDLGQVSFCDSQGLGTLVVLNREAARAGQALILAHVRPFLERTLDVTGLKKTFRIRP